MKRWMGILLLSLGFMLFLSGYAQAAVHDAHSNFQNVGLYFEDTPQVNLLRMFPPEISSWFSIEPDAPSFRIRMGFCQDDPLYSFDYYINDQTFANLNVSIDNGTTTNFRGSYLSKSGFFIGLDYYRYQNQYGSTTDSFITPGYRWNIGEKHYTAISADYHYSDYEKRITGYDFDFQFMPDNMLIYGQIYKPVGSDLAYDAEADFKTGENLVLGIGINGQGDNKGYLLGATWVSSKLVLDGAYEHRSTAYYSEYEFKLSGMFALTTNFSLGLEYDNPENNDDVKTIKAQYRTKFVDLALAYDETNIYFTYNLNF